MSAYFPTHEIQYKSRVDPTHFTKINLANVIPSCYTIEGEAFHYSS